MDFNLGEFDKILEKKFGRVGTIISTALLILILLVVFVYGIGFLYEKLSSTHSWITEKKNTVSEQVEIKPPKISVEEKDTAELLDLITRTLDFLILEMDDSKNPEINSMKRKTVYVQNRHKLKTKLSELGIDGPSPQEETHPDFDKHWRIFLSNLQANVEYDGTYKKSKNLWKHYEKNFEKREENKRNHCFTFQQGRVDIEKGKLVRFSVDVINNTDSTKENVTTRVLFLDWSLDKTIEPLYIGEVEHANAKGPGEGFEHIVEFKTGLFVLPLFAVFEARCVDSKNKKLNSQIRFLTIGTEAGILKDKVYEAHLHERTRIEVYIQERRIPKFQ